MNWQHVNLIFKREMVDQLRDRRTIFTITVLPLLLYPLLGMLMMQVAQFHRESPVKVLVLGHENWPEDLPLLDAEGGLVLDSVSPEAQRLVEFSLQAWPTTDEVSSHAKQLLKTEKADAVLVISEELSKRFQGESTGESTKKTTDTSDDSSASTVSSNPSPGLLATNETSDSGLSLFTNMARDQSSIAQGRVSRLIDHWWDQWRMRQMAQAGLAPSLSAPIKLKHIDTSVTSVRQAVRWSKILPFIMLVWALTGAFYPAVDLCAGEKERGTLETLLSSPARRREIVWGKLLTINTFSICSALLNLMSMQFTAGLVVRNLAASGTGDIALALGPMPFHSLGWLVLLLIPMSAFFSALALAVAALAKSSKEGQYYLMPLLLVTLPLVGLPMIPSMELSLGNCLIPVSGAVFLVRSLIEGRYQEAVIHLPIVLIVTTVCCAMAVRWAVRQFESESVMFNEGRWDLRSWLQHLWRDRQDSAQPSVALLCGVLILVVKFFANFLVSPKMPLVTQLLLVQFGMILLPCVVMAVLLTRNPRRALRIHRVQPSHILAAIMIGLTLHPSYKILGEAIMGVYPIAPETVALLKDFQSKMLENPLWLILLLMAVIPAICEELAYRGFIFGGLLRQQGVLRALVVSALLFGFTHAVLQQSISASVMGLILGFIAWRTGGVICTIIVHFINNALTLTMAWCSERQTAVPEMLSWVIKADADGWSYHPSWHFSSIVFSVALLLIIYQRSRHTERSVLAEMA
jgi:sodium transport system permease protein